MNKYNNFKHSGCDNYLFENPAKGRGVVSSLVNKCCKQIILQIWKLQMFAGAFK